jgi:hypothetical protein
MNTARLLFLICLAFCVQTEAQTNEQQDARLWTNTFSLTQNDIRDFEKYADVESHYVRYRVYGEAMPEFLPADQDTNGNWGPITNGLQLSLRFTRGNKYIIGDAIVAETVLRNLQPYPQTLLLTNSWAMYMTFLVRNETNGCPPERKREVYRPRDDYEPPSLPPSGFLSWPLDARSERIIAIDLNALFDLSKQGKYSVTAICRVYSPVTKLPIYEISSGAVSFTINEKPPSAK